MTTDMAIITFSMMTAHCALDLKMNVRTFHAKVMESHATVMEFHFYISVKAL